MTEFEPPMGPGAGKPRGRKPQGQRPLSGAERQARYRRRQAAHHPAPPPQPRSARRASRPQRWHNAVAELVALQAEYASWLNKLPEALRDTAAGEALQTIVDLEIEDFLAVELPQGFGRD